MMQYKRIEFITNGQLAFTNNLCTYRPNDGRDRDRGGYGMITAINAIIPNGVVVINNVEVAAAVNDRNDRNDRNGGGGKFEEEILNKTFEELMVS